MCTLRAVTLRYIGVLKILYILFKHIDIVGYSRKAISLGKRTPSIYSFSHYCNNDLANPDQNSFFSLLFCLNFQSVALECSCIVIYNSCIIFVINSRNSHLKISNLSTLIMHFGITLVINTKVLNVIYLKPPK